MGENASPLELASFAILCSLSRIRHDRRVKLVYCYARVISSRSYSYPNTFAAAYPHPNHHTQTHQNINADDYSDSISNIDAYKNANEH